MGSLGAAAPKPVFAYFCLAAKVGRARGRETFPDPLARIANFLSGLWVVAEAQKVVGGHAVVLAD